MRWPPPERVTDLSEIEPRLAFFYEPRKDGTYQMRKVVQKRIGSLYKHLRTSRTRLSPEVVSAFIAHLRREAIER